MDILGAPNGLLLTKTPVAYFEIINSSTRYLNTLQ